MVRRILGLMLRRVGLVPFKREQALIKREEELRADLRRARERSDTLTKALAEARQVSGAKVQTFRDRVDTLTKALAEARQHSQELRAKVQKHSGEIERLRASREAAGQERVEKARKAMQENARQLQICREQLMLLEVKLDIVEGAINILDARTRAVLARGQEQTSDRT